VGGRANQPAAWARRRLRDQARHARNRQRGAAVTDRDDGFREEHLAHGWIRASVVRPLSYAGRLGATRAVEHLKVTTTCEYATTTATAPSDSASFFQSQPLELLRPT